MRSILYVSCSPKGPQSVSLAFAEELLDRLGPASITRRDLAADPPPLADAAYCTGIMTPGADLPASEALIREIEQADVLVIATPMHNYTVPAVLKAWIDQVVRIHRSFASTPGGKVGLLRDRPVYIVITSGGWFSGPAPSGAPPQPDFLTPYLTAILNTIGLTDIHFLTLEGVTRGPEMLDRALAKARSLMPR